MRHGRWILALLLACKEKGGESGGAETGLCADAPVIMYANFGEGFLIENCQACHASTSVDRNGAPDGVVFDTLDDAISQADRILAVATGDAATMPPQGGVDDEDREKLEIWLTCWIDDEEGA